MYVYNHAFASPRSPTLPEKHLIHDPVDYHQSLWTNSMLCGLSATIGSINSPSGLIAHPLGYQQPWGLSAVPIG